VKIKDILTIALICQMLIGCFGDDSDNSNTSPYAGAWYNESGKHYLEIESDNTVTMRQCTMHNGYAPFYTGSVDGDKLDIFSMSFNLSLEGNILTLKDADGNVIFEYVRASSVPDVCNGDAIEITFSSPTSVTEGILTTFQVDFDYRLSSTNNGIVYLGFNTGEANAFTLTTSTFEVYTTGTGSASLSADIIPVLYSSPDSFAIYVNISENPHPGSWSPLASNIIDVRVNPSHAKKKYKESGNPINSKQLCSNDIFIQCLNE